jgi:NAD(P)-dependent dehydrogenase (short-subunit alcohol dehydrogenase family)
VMVHSEASVPGGVVVTGCSTGIGRAVALRLDRLGWQVFAGVRRKEDAASLSAAAQGPLRPIMIDVTDEDQILAAAAEVGQALDERGLRGLVNNAGVVVSGPIECLPLDDLRRQFEVNVLGVVAVTRQFLPMLRRAGGRVVNIGSVSGRSAMPFLGPYAASKHALEALTDAMRLEFRPFGLKISIIEPSAVDTPIWDKSTAQAEQAAQDFSGDCDELYRPAMSAVSELAQASARGAVDPAVVADKVVHALTARRPRARYLVGAGAWQLKILERLPTRLRDWLIWREIAKRTNNDKPD